MQVVPESATPEGIASLNYAYVALVAFWAYDYLTTLYQELPFLTTSAWRLVKYLYIICRYLPFPYLSFVLLRSQDPSPSVTTCQTYYSLTSYIGGIIIFAAECIFFVRTYAIWDRSKRILWAFIASVLFVLTPIVYILVKYNSSNTITTASSLAPGVRGCCKTAESDVVVAVYVLLVTVESEILFLTLYQSLASYKRQRHNLNILHILVQHNVFYYTFGFISSLILIFAIIFCPVSYSDFASCLQVTAHAVLVTRMHRELWRYSDDFSLTEQCPSTFSLTTFNPTAHVGQCVTDTTHIHAPRNYFSASMTDIIHMNA